MAAKEKTVKRVVAHPKLYLRVDGALQRMAVGTEVTLSESEAEGLKGKLADPSEAKQLKDGELTSGDEGGNAEQLEAAQGEITTLTEQLKAAQGAIVELQKSDNVQAVQKLAEQLATAQAEVKKLKKAAT